MATEAWVEHLYSRVNQGLEIPVQNGENEKHKTYITLW